MKRKSLLSLFCVGTCIAIVGCSGKQAQNLSIENGYVDYSEITTQVQIENESKNKSNHISMELCENVKVDANVKVPDGFSGSAYRYDAYVAPFTLENILPLFELDEKDVEKLSENLYRYQDTFFEISNDICGSLVINTESVDYYYKYNSDYLEACTDMIDFGENKELAFKKSELVKTEVCEKLKSIGINNVVVKHIYALPVEYHQYIEKTYIESGMMEENKQLGERWNSIGDCYEIVLTTEIDGIPIFEDTYVAEDDTAFNGGKIQILFSEEGIKYLNAPNQYRIREQEYEIVNVLGNEEILDVIKNKMTSIILTDTYTVTELELCYLPQIINKQLGDFWMLPVWNVTLIASDGTSINYLFRADNGEEIQW